MLPDCQAEVATTRTRNHPDILVVNQDCSGEYAKAPMQEDLPMSECADCLHIVKNFIEAIRLLLARSEAEIVAASKMSELDQNEQHQQVISIEEWRPKEPAYHGIHLMAVSFGDEHLHSKENFQKGDVE